MKTGNLLNSAGPASAKALFQNFLIDRVTTKSAWEYSSSGLERWTRCNKWGNIRGRCSFL